MSDSMQEKLAQMRIDYGANLQKIANDVESWRGAARIQELIFLCHKYGGSAGTFGFDETSDHLKAMENDLLALSEAPTDEMAETYFKKVALILRQAAL